MVVDQQDHFAGVLLEFCNEVEHHGHFIDAHAGGRLVEHENLRLQRHHQRDLEFALVAMGSALRAVGNFRPGMVVSTATVIINMVLAPFLIFGWGTGRAFGVAGTIRGDFVLDSYALTDDRLRHRGADRRGAISGE